MRKLTLADAMFSFAALGIVLVVLLLALTRWSGRRPHYGPQCMNNLRQLAIATHFHEETRQQLPHLVGYYGIYRGTTETVENDRTTTSPAHFKLAPLSVALMPFLDQQSLYETWSLAKHPVIAFTDRRNGEAEYLDDAVPNVFVFQCPSTERFAFDRARNAYACNAGLYAPGSFTQAERPSGLTESLFSPRWPSMDQDPRNEVPKLERAPPPPSLDDIADGLSNTLIFTENLQALPWHRVGFLTAGNLVTAPGEPAAQPLDTLAIDAQNRFGQGVVWHWESDRDGSGLPPVQSVHRINGVPQGESLATLVMTPANAADVARPSSNHGAQVNIALADGSIRSLSSSIDYQVYQSLLCPNDAAYQEVFPVVKPDSDAGVQ